MFLFSIIIKHTINQLRRLRNMPINAISNVSFQGFRSNKNNNKKKPVENQTNPIEVKNNTPQNKVSNNAFSKATKAMALAVLMTPIAGSMMTSCEDNIDIDIRDELTIYNPKDTLFIPIWQKPDTVWMDKIIHDTTFVEVPGKTDTLYIPKTDTLYINKTDTLYLPGQNDTIYIPKVDTVFVPKVDTVYIPKTDTIVKHDTIPYPVIIPGDTVYIRRKYDSEVFDIMKDMMEEVGITPEGNGDIITRIIGKDEWNNALNVYDLKGKKSSERTPVYDRTTYGWDDEEEAIVPGKNMTYGELSISKSQNGGLYLEHNVPRGSASQKPETADGYRLDKETTLTKGTGMLLRRDITGGQDIDKGSIRPGDEPKSVFFFEPYGHMPGEELMWRWSDIAVKLGEKPEDEQD